MIIQAVGTALLAMASAAAAAQTPPPQPGLLAEQVIALAVGEARCTGEAGKMLARHRPFVMAANAEQIRVAGQAMAQRYQQHYGDGWQAALHDDLARLRAGFQQQADTAKFCSRTAWQARRMADAARYGKSDGSNDLASGAFRDPRTIENDVNRLFDRIR